MKQELTFYRAKAKDKSWRYGYGIRYKSSDCLILYDNYGVEHEIVRETVGRCSDLMDKNSMNIFEGDIHKNVHNDLLFIACLGAYFDTEYETDAYGWYWKCINRDYVSGFSGYEHSYVNIIGNIHDNPELLEGQQ